MQDMIPPQIGRSIRNIPVSNKPQRPMRPKPIEQGEEEFNDAPPPLPRRPRRFRLALWLVLGVALVCVAVGLLLSTVLAGASITLYPKIQEVTPPATVLAQPNAPLGMVSYQTMSTTQFATTTVSTSGMQHVSKPATGVITIFNAHSTASQELVATTRFSAPDGKVYRIRSTVVVPGATKKTDGT